MKTALLAALAALAALVLLAGCAQKTDETPAATADSTSAHPSTSASMSASPSVVVAPLELKVQPPAATQNETLTLKGTVSHVAKVSVGTLSTQAEGAWTLRVPVGYGHTNLTVTADDGHATQQAKLVAVRLASATFDVKYTLAAPPHPSSHDTVWYDPDGRASAFLYTANGTEHPPIANVHDVMVSWTQQTGTRVTYGGPGGFGFSIDAIDGVGQPLTSQAPPYWGYKLNGKTAGLGITSQEIHPGDALLFEYLDGT